ncbi:protein kinase [Bradyrhizobium sp. 180]|uniref:protein kinase domain-containing protein n=1 Tax=Bradyrhizobium sp. 180 TaxID=2782650 RepID=UPI001FF98695|nr:protein kinase [Bradyrhizobium sp. 180]MCK1489756.1 protein kinase [Bradyrhizobium sp. 180]
MLERTEESHRKPLEIGRSIAGYHIVSEIGRGGFGIVYEAVNPVTKERVAIKQFYPQAIASWVEGTIVVKREDDQEFVERILQRFEDEATVQFNFVHPNILRVKNFVRADNTGYLISEYVDGVNLLQFLKPHGNVFSDASAFRRTMEPIADAIAYVHERLVLHRDISPDNILIDKAGRPVLVDFGAAKLDLRRSAGVSSLVPYKEAYAPVEQQVPGPERPEGYYTDIYALAGTMYCTLSGKPPARAIDRVLASQDPYVSLAVTTKVRCPEAVYSAIDKGLSLSPPSRPQTIEDFVHLFGWRARSRCRVSESNDEMPRLLDMPLLSAAKGNDLGRIGSKNRRSAYVFVAALIAAVIGVLFFVLGRPPLDQSSNSRREASTVSTEPTSISTPEATYIPAPAHTPVPIDPSGQASASRSPDSSSHSTAPSSGQQSITPEARASQPQIEPRITSPGASSPSFDCSTNRSVDEQAICRSPQLSYKDQQLAAIYSNLRQSLNSSAAIRLRDEQRAWLKSRSGCGANEHCLSQLYAARIQALQSWR